MVPTPVRFPTASAQYYRRYGVLAPYVPELIAMRAGLKASIQLLYGCEEDLSPHRAALEDFCQRTGFSLSVLRDQRLVKVRLSTQPLVDDELHDHSRIGQQLSYPDCCVEQYIGQDRRNPLIDHLGALLVDDDPLPYWMNPFLRTSPFHLYKHYPCSLRCAATQELARTLLSRIEADNPELHRDLRTYLPCPVLFTDICGAGISLVGRVTRRDSAEAIVCYEDSFCDVEPTRLIHLSHRNTPTDVALFEQLRQLLDAGDRLILTSAHCRVEREGERVGQLPRPPHLTWRLVVYEPPAIPS